MKDWRREAKWYVQRIKNIYHWAVSMFYVARYGYSARKLTVIGVTGTDGKTTTCTLIYEILKAAGGEIKPALVSTVSARIGTQEIDTGLHTTNPDARELQPLLARMVKEGVTHLVLEVTAHGLDQHRLLGTNISIGVLTNVTHDHLDDFITMKRYTAAKMKLFKGVSFAVLPKDDPAYENFQFSILNFQSNNKIKIIKYGKSTMKGVSGTLAGDYNLYNLGAAEAVAGILKIDYGKLKIVAQNFAGVPGRRQEVSAGQKFKVFVDFAHTPNGLEQMLKSFVETKIRNSQLIVVFGCTGERDREKRPVMGRIAATLADRVIVTSDDTRGENQDEIAAQIMSGISKSQITNHKVVKENDRRKAIEMAFSEARPGDVVLLVGKGHEKSINLGGKEYPWSDVEVARQILDSRS